MPRLSSTGHTKIKPKPRRLGRFRVVKRQTDRNNPQALRRTIYDILQHSYQGNLHEAASDLAKQIRKSKDRDLRAKFTDQGLYEVTYDRSHIYYYLLDALAKKLGIPAGFILIYSRLSANQTDSSEADSLAMCRALREIFGTQKYQETEIFNKGNISFNDLLEWCEVYARHKEQAAQSQLSLF